MTKVMLWNSMQGKVYSQSDSFLDNGLGLLSAACKKEGLEVIIEDPADIQFMDTFVRSDLTKQKEYYGITSVELTQRLHELAPDVFIPIVPPDQKTFILEEWRRLQEVSKQITEEKMDCYLDSLVAKVIKEKCDIVGMKVWLGERHKYSEIFAEKISRKAPDVITIAGGPQVNIYRGECLKGSPFDLAIEKEGETALVKVANVVGDLKERGATKEDILKEIAKQARRGEIPNLIYRTGRNIKHSKLNLIPLSKKPDYDYSEQKRKVRIAVVEDGIGCYYRRGCNFCTHNPSLGKYRVQRTDELIRRIKGLIRQDIGLFRFSSSSTPANRGARIAEEILKEGINMRFSMFTRAENNADRRYDDLKEKYRTMIQAGLRAVFLGVECADQQVLDVVMGKGNTVSDMYHTVKALDEAAKMEGQPIDIGVSFIYPVPTKGTNATQESVLEKNLRFLERLTKEGVNIGSVLVTPPGPIPNTRWFKESEKFGFDLFEDFFQFWMRYNFELGKDPSSWPDLPVELDGKKWKEIMDLTGRMGRLLFQKGYPVNLTDEHCIAARAAGIYGKWGLTNFKLTSDFAIFSGKYDYLREVYEKIDLESKRIARSNRFHPRYKPYTQTVTLDDGDMPLKRVPETEAMDEEIEVREFSKMSKGITHLYVIDIPFVAEASNLGVRKGKVLDAACGEGEISRRIANLGSYSVWGVDLSEEMIKYARSKRGNLPTEFSVGDISEMGFEDGFFDLVICNHLLHHIPDEDKMIKVLRELKRVSKPDGAMLIKDVCRPESEQKLEEYMAKFGTVYPYGLQRRIYEDSIKAALNFEEWKELFSEAGLLDGIGIELKQTFNMGCPTHLVYVKRAI